ncbi:MAG: D-glycerate dehydrogenase [Paenibacillaceae bacterium]
MNKTVYIARPIPSEVRQYLEEHCHCLDWQGEGRITKDDLFEMLSAADGLLTSGTPINAELLDHAPKLKIISNISVGYNNYDLDEMRKRGIIGTHTPGVLDDTVADLIVGLMLAAARRISELDQLMRQGLWKKGMDEEMFGVDVHHATLGIIGMGRIGEAVAQRARFGFNMNVLYSNRSRNAEAEKKLGARYCSMDELLIQSDYIVVMTPLTKETEKLIGHEQFAMMKSTAIFINASRGPIVDEAALIEALQSGSIRAAGLDVFEVEPIQLDNPLLKLPNVVLMPHVGSATTATRSDMAMLAAKNLVAGLSGQVPPNVVKELLRLDEQY